LIVQNPIEQRLVDQDAALVFDIAQFAKAIHKEAHARTRRTNHLCKSFLRNGMDERHRFARLAVVGHQEQYPRQTPLTGIEDLIDKIGLNSLTATEHIREKQRREIRLFP
jgi:hypothetical protein